MNKKKLISIIIAIILAIVIVPSAIYCIAKQETPVQMISDTFKSTEKQLIGKWQNDTGVSAYEFFEDGTFDGYLSTFDYKGTYEVKGSNLTLEKPGSGGSVTYKATVTEKKLVLKLVKENDEKIDDIDKEKIEFNRVEVINTKSINDLINDLTEEAEANQEAEK